MRRFAELYLALDRTTRTSEKLAAIVDHVRSAPAEDAAWAVYFLTGRRLKGLLASGELASLAARASGLPGWILLDSFAVVGDFAETIALVLDDPSRERASGSDLPLSRWVEERLLTLPERDEDEKRAAVLSWLRELPASEVLILVKLLTGELRVGVSATLVARALGLAAGLPPATIQERLMGAWTPSGFFFEKLMSREASLAEPSRPYPFCLSSPLDRPLSELEGEWLAEWKWDGIRAQLMARAGKVHVWSRGEELVTERFPELVKAGKTLPEGTVLDGEIVIATGEVPLPFSVLQTRIGRKKLGRKLLAQAPAVFMAFDLLEEGGLDIRALPLRERRARLERLLERRDMRLRLSPRLAFEKLEDLAALRAQARSRGVEGIVLKGLETPYRAGRKRGDWWKWKIDPFTVDCVLVQAEPGHGRRATLFTDYTFACWERGVLVPVAKAYSGLSDPEIDRLDGWIREHTLEWRGVARLVEPVHVFEIAFERIARSRRHASGVALRFPRIARWRSDKQPRDADSLDTLRALLPPESRRESGQGTLFPL